MGAAIGPLIENLPVGHLPAVVLASVERGHSGFGRDFFAKNAKN
jgi:hypothetical protein